MQSTTYTSNDVTAALAKVVPTAPDRLLRLFSLACLRRVRHLLSDTFCSALDVAELHVNGRVSDAELGAAVTAVKRASGRRRSREWAVYHAVRYVKGSPEAEAANIAAWAAEIARDSIALPERSTLGVHDSHIRGFFLVGGEGQPSMVASSNEPPPPNAPADLVAAYERAISELRIAEEADEARAQRQADAQEAEFRQA
jgi:hypothetical protein